jgi:photosystem II stability/assembly factor-like uncharacterized protein
MLHRPTRVIRRLCRFVAMLGFLAAASAGHSFAHDGTSYGGVYRSRDMGGTWLGIDVGLFLRSAIAIAVDPNDPAHLLLGTDIGLLRTRNGGRQWAIETTEGLIGQVTAVAFTADGERALAAGPAGVFTSSAGRRRLPPRVPSPRDRSAPVPAPAGSIFWAAAGFS